MDCKEVERRLVHLSAAAEEEMDAPVLRHVERCPECGVLYRLVRDLFTHCSTHPEPRNEPDWDAFSREIKGRLIVEACAGRRRLEEVKAWLERMFRPASGMGLAVTAAMLVFILGISVFGINRNHPASVRTAERGSTSASAVLPVSFIPFDTGEQVSLSLQSLSPDELSYLCCALLRRMGEERHMADVPELLNPPAELPISDQRFMPIQSRLSSLGPAELQRVAYALDHMLPN